jgi:predicted N-acetyltransferase YhbS
MAGGSPAPPDFKLRPGRLEEAPELGRICFEAFNSISSRHGFPCDFPSAEIATEVLRGLLGHPKFYSVVAESNGRLLGSNFLDERAIITGVGPITVDPAYQNSRVGRELMMDVMRRSSEAGAAGCRLVQAAYHTRSLALYSKLGFEPREPLTNFQGAPPNQKIEGRQVRKADMADLQACNELCVAVHGHERGGELMDSIKGGGALVVEHAGRITGYSTGLAWLGHSVGESNEDIMALISSVEAFGGPGILVPTRNYGLLRWCLQEGLRINQQTTLMTIGLYNEPRGAYLPSVLF